MADKETNAVLVVEDEENISSFVKLYLDKEGYQVSVAETAEEARDKFDGQDWQLVVLDLMLPDGDGLDVCKHMRAASDVPIIMLTARDEDIDKIVGLEMGADDYMTKPFNPRELVARIKAIMRRAQTPPERKSTSQACGDLSMDAEKREVRLAGKTINLSPKEFDLLWELIEAQGKVLSREYLLEKVWGYKFFGDTRTVDVHVRQLRRKLAEGCPILTVWGSGYKIGLDDE